MLNIIEGLYSFENSFKTNDPWHFIINYPLGNGHNIDFCLQNLSYYLLWYITKYKQDPVVISYLIIVVIITDLHWQS